jgi:plasmid maintenance system antidote protein VapI
MQEKSLQVHPSQIEILQKAYKANGHTNQADLAEAVGFSVDTLSRFLNGHKVSREAFMKFCEALDLDHEEMIQEPRTSNSTSGTQITQSAEINNGFMIGTIGTFNQ